MYPIRRGFCAEELCAEAQNDSPLRRMSGGGPGGCNGKNQKERMELLRQLALQQIRTLESISTDKLPRLR